MLSPSITQPKTKNKNLSGFWWIPPPKKKLGIFGGLPSGWFVVLYKMQTFWGGLGQKQKQKKSGNRGHIIFQVSKMEGILSHMF